MTVTRGGRALRSKRKQLSLSQEDLAERLHVKQSTVSLWERFISRPETHHRTVLEILVGIPADWWLTKEERATIKRATALAATGTEG